VDRAYIYFFNDEDKAGLHASSGLTRHFKPKPAFHAVSQLRQTLGDCRFRRIVSNKTGKLRVHEYQDGTSPGRVIWAVWSPTGGNESGKVVLTDVPGRLVSSFRMPLTDTPVRSTPARQDKPGTVELEICGSPVYLVLEK
jgi:hypothetical protein